MDRRSWKFFGVRAPAGTSIFRASWAGPVDSAATKTPNPAGGKFGDPRFSGDDPLDYISEPLMVLDGGGNIVAANVAARAFIGQPEMAFDGSISVESVLTKVCLANGGGVPSWVPISGTSGFDAMVTSPEPLTGAPIFELRTKPRASAGGAEAGWVVLLVEVTPLIASLREQRSAVDQRDQLLKLLSHDMRTPLAAILTTLRHPDLVAMPDNPRQIIENAAYRALHMVDRNVRLIRAQCSDYTFVALDPRYVIEEVIDSVWSLGKANGVKLVLVPPNDEVLILADRGFFTEALTDLCRQLLNTTRAGRTLQWELKATTFNGGPAVTLSIGEVGNKPAERTRFQATRDPASHIATGTDLSDDADGVVFLKTVVARHFGTAALERAQGAEPSVSITIPAIEA